MAKTKPKTIPLPKEKIDKVFEDPEIAHQSDAVLAIYKIAIPDIQCAHVVRIEGHPTINQETNEYLFKKFMAFDKQHHPDVMCGGLWMNNGFSCMDCGSLPSWEISMENCRVVYAGEDRLQLTG